MSKHTYKTENIEVDLYVRGKACYDHATKRSSWLRFLEELCSALVCSDRTQLEWTSTFLLRACTDAVASGLTLPVHVLTVVVQRHVLSCLDDRRITNAIAALTPSLDIPHGITLLKSSPAVLRQCQYDTACDICTNMVGSQTLTTDAFAHSIKSLTDLIENESLKSVFTTVGVVQNPDAHPASTVETACLDLSGHSKVAAPATIIRTFTAGAAKNMLVDARSSVMQRRVDSGRIVCVIGLRGCLQVPKRNGGPYGGDSESDRVGLEREGGTMRRHRNTYS